MQSLSQIAPVTFSHNKGNYVISRDNGLLKNANLAAVSVHFTSCSSDAWATKSACSLTVCVPSETGKKNNLIRNNPAKNKYQRRKSRRKTDFFPYLPDESVNYDMDCGLYLKQRCIRPFHNYLVITSFKNIVIFSKHNGTRTKPADCYKNLTGHSVNA